MTIEPLDRPITLRELLVACDASSWRYDVLAALAKSLRETKPTSPPSSASGPYSIGSNHWPGLSKLVEEAGEAQQVLGKLLGTGGEVQHWDGSDLRQRLVEELGDLIAAISFFVAANGLDVEQLDKRSKDKLVLFESWHRSPVPVDPSPPAVTFSEMEKVAASQFWTYCLGQLPVPCAVCQKPFVPEPIPIGPFGPGGTQSMGSLFLPHKFVLAVCGPCRTLTGTTLPFHGSVVQAGSITVSQPKASNNACRSCPCEFSNVEPCSDRCSCRQPLSSGGCSRCVRYGSLEQQEAAAQEIVRREHDLVLARLVAGSAKEAADRLRCRLPKRCGDCFGTKKKGCECVGSRVAAALVVLDQLANLVPGDKT